MLENLKKAIDRIAYPEKEKEEIIKKVLENPDYLEKISNKWKNNEELFKGLINNVEEKYKSNELNISKKSEFESIIYSQMGDNLKNNKKFLSNVMDIDSSAVIYASENLKKDKEFAVIAIEKDSFNYIFIDENLKKDKEFVSELVKEKPEILKFVPDQIKNDKKFILEVIEENPKAFQFISKEIKPEVEMHFMRKKLDLYLENDTPEKLKEMKELVNKIAELKADRENVNRDLYFTDIYDKSNYYEVMDNYEKEINELGKINPKALKLADELVTFYSSPASDAKNDIDLKIFNKTVDLKIKELNVTKNNDKGVNLDKPEKEEIEVMRKVANFSKEYLQDFSKELKEKMESKINNLENAKNKAKIHIPKKQKNKHNENER